MRKIFMIGVIIMCAGTSAHAGIFDALGLGQKKEPTTLADACDTAEIKKICPEIILGDMTMAQCLMKNIKELSAQCATYVKKTAGETLNHFAVGQINASDDAKIAAAKQKQAAAQHADDARTAAKELGDHMRVMKQSAKKLAETIQPIAQ